MSLFSNIKHTVHEYNKNSLEVFIKTMHDWLYYKDNTKSPKTYFHCGPRNIKLLQDITTINKVDTYPQGDNVH